MIIQCGAGIPACLSLENNYTQLIHQNVNWYPGVASTVFASEEGRQECLPHSDLENNPFQLIPQSVNWYERKLPHWHPEEASIFLTWMLKGAIPLQCKRSPFADEDAKLDRGDSGPTWLKDASCAKIVAEAIEHGEASMKMYKLIAYVVMSNHVHLLICPLVPVPKITRVLKGYTAREINRLLNRTGQALWQDESFDRWMRGGKDERTITRYIEMNPVTAGLVHTAEQWLWSTASRKAGKNACPTGATPT